MRFALLLLISTLLSCSSAATSGPVLVLIHGAHFDERSWDLLKHQLSVDRVYSLSLFDESEDQKSLSLDVYARRVCDFVKDLGKVVLLGHSQGGAVINQVFGICPENINSLIYVSATIPFPGEKAFDLLEARDDEYYFSAIIENKKKEIFEIKDENLFIKGFAQDFDENQKVRLLKLIRAEPIKPSKTKLSFNIDRFQRLKKFVIYTKNDRIITFDTQKKYADRLQNTEFFDIQSGHLPMISYTHELSLLIENILGDF